MKRKSLLLTGAFIGVFSLGAMFSPIIQSNANTSEQTSVKNMSVFQTAANKNTSAQIADNYTCPMTGAPMGSGMGRYFSGTSYSIIADTLGIAIDELQTALNSGKTIAALAEEKGKSVDDLVNAVLQSRKAELQKLVDNGTMTQEQMDYMLNNMDTQIRTAIENDNFGNGRGKGMGYGGRHHMNFY